MVLSTTHSYEYKDQPLKLAILNVRDIDRPVMPENTTNLNPFLEYVSTKLEPEAKEVSVAVDSRERRGLLRHRHIGGG